MQPSCTPSHKTTAYQTNDALVDSNSRDKQFTLLRYHVTYNNMSAHNHKNTWSHVARPSVEPPFQAHLPDLLLPVSPSNLGLVNFFNQCKSKIVCDSMYMIQNRYQEYQYQMVKTMCIKITEQCRGGNIKWQIQSYASDILQIISSASDVSVIRYVVQWS